VSVQLDTQIAANIDGRGPRISFRISRSIDRQPDHCDLTIYGLAPERGAALQAQWVVTGRSILRVMAGYDLVMQPLFLGDVRELDAGRRSGPDRTCFIAADDAGAALSEVTYDAAYGAKALTAAEQIEVALALWAASGYPIGKSPSVAQAIASTVPTATVHLTRLSGQIRAADIVDNAARQLRARWWVRDSLLYMVPQRFALPGPALDVTTVLLSDPEQSGDRSYLSTFFDPFLTPGRSVVCRGIRSRIDSVEHSGDTHSSQPWASNLEVRLVAG
jgi:hypothetical protein